MKVGRKCKAVRGVSFSLTATAVAAWLLFAASGCASVSSSSAPSSAATLNQAANDAASWAKQAPDRSWSFVAATGSMLPLMDQRSISLYEKYTEHTQLAVGDWIVFDRGDQPNVLHRVLEVTPKDFFVSGVNTPRSDGWFPRSRIKLRVAGILYTSH